MSESPVVPLSEIERVFRQEYGRAVASLVRVFRDISIAEEAVQDAFTTAVQRWPSTGLPPSPAGWIMAGRAFEEDVVDDDRLRLIFTCCHPALAPNAQVALTLRLLGGLTTAEIARAFLVRSVFGPFWPLSTSSSTRDTQRLQASSWSARISALRLSALDGSWPI